MTCINLGNAIVCVSPWGRLKVGNRYVWVDFHEYCGPAFYRDSAMTKVYDPEDENDPVWGQFDRWLKKYRAGKEKQAKQRAHQSAATHPKEQTEAREGGQQWE